MKALTLLVTCLLSKTIFTQSKYLGNYRDFFGASIVIKADSTFKYEWHAHIQESWTIGTWTLFNDTIYFNIVPVYDTLKLSKPNGKILDSLVLARFDKSVRKTPLEIALSNYDGQNYRDYPTKLFYKRNKLCTIEDGKLIKRKIKSENGKYPPWFVKRSKHKY